MTNSNRSAQSEPTQQPRSFALRVSTSLSATSTGINRVIRGAANLVKF